mmetsp:Transcript_19059/g.32937  ORF Transcript_19059/g.32937 Transcript_19059/m.32937 type:complete len:235 (-) Transcript_19059:10-714(-)
MACVVVGLLSYTSSRLRHCGGDKVFSASCAACMPMARLSRWYMKRESALGPRMEADKTLFHSHQDTKPSPSTSNCTKIFRTTSTRDCSSSCSSSWSGTLASCNNNSTAFSIPIVSPLAGKASLLVVALRRMRVWPDLEMTCSNSADETAPDLSTSASTKDFFKPNSTRAFEEASTRERPTELLSMRTTCSGTALITNWMLSDTTATRSLVFGSKMSTFVTSQGEAPSVSEEVAC